MFCPCCAGRTHDVDESGNFDGNGYSPLPGQPGIHRTSEPCKLRIPGDLLGAPLPVIMDLPAEFIRHSLSDWIYNARAQRHAIWNYLSLDQICTTYAGRLLLESDNRLSYLYCVEEVFDAPRLPDSLTGRGMAGSCESSTGIRSGRNRHPYHGRYGQGDYPQRAPLFG